jgi:hypothetical protein
MPNSNNKIPIVSLNKSVICINNEHPIPYQELKPRWQNIPQTRCVISLINRPQPCCCHDFSTALFLPQFFCYDFSVAPFLSHFFCNDFSFALFLPQFSYLTFSSTLFLLHFSCRIFPPTIFLSHFSCCTFSVALFFINDIFPKNLSQNIYSMIFNRC